ncbi:hypothetical protein GCK72_019966 [Caenorhabditis remanei]|uniref:Serpin domain-containing protein n=1 Tax=Caenorhabditis remanei TaxID=31234 RepID=A0A6A5GG77_CAERE|nr:hypothetical protein GCK72_019966 [Caenorhabditis remanei]KAF1753409.1 hypothetical protein GCK72_019966 [Caenorhabditis remanei]
MTRLLESSKNGFMINQELNFINTSYTATWRYLYMNHHHHTMKFHTENQKLKHVNYVSANTKMSEELVSNGLGFRTAQDDVFTILKIPLFGRALRFVIFLPNPEFTLDESIKKLSSSRVQNLFNSLTVYNVHYKIPYFQMSSTIDPSKLLGLQTSKFHKFRFNWKRPSETYLYEENDGFNESFIKRPPDRTPFYFTANRPFFYAVFNDTLPIIMGVFTGTNCS